MANFELDSEETMLEAIKGDYWEKSFIFYSQKSGRIWITNKRISFRGGFATSLDLLLNEIEGIEPCKVGPFIRFLPTGILIRMKNGKTYQLSVLKRQKYIDSINQARGEIVL